MECLLSDRESDNDISLSHSYNKEKNIHGDDSAEDDLPLARLKKIKSGDNTPLSHLKSETSIGGQSNTHGVSKDANTPTKKLPRRGSNKPLSHVGESNTHDVPNDANTHTKKPLPHGGESNTHGVSSDVITPDKQPQRRGSNLRRAEVTKTSLPHGESNTHGVPSHANKSEKRPETRGSKTTRKKSFDESFDDAEINFNTPLNDIEATNSAIDSEHTFDADSKVSASKRISRRVKKEPVDDYKVDTPQSKIAFFGEANRAPRSEHHSDAESEHDSEAHSDADRGPHSEAESEHDSEADREPDREPPIVERAKKKTLKARSYKKKYRGRCANFGDSNKVKKFDKRRWDPDRDQDIWHVHDNYILEDEIIENSNEDGEHSRSRKRKKRDRKHMDFVISKQIPRQSKRSREHAPIAERKKIKQIHVQRRLRGDSQPGDGLMTRRELLKDEDVIVKFVPHFHRIADPMLDEIN